MNELWQGTMSEERPSRTSTALGTTTFERFKVGPVMTLEYLNDILTRTKRSRVVTQGPEVQWYACPPFRHMITARRLRIEKPLERDPRVRKSPEQSNRKNDIPTPETIDGKARLGINQSRKKNHEEREKE
jgi:hypothetical protein